MIDHVGLRVQDFERCKAFYAAALAPLGYKIAADYSPDAVGFGDGKGADFWVSKHPTPGTCHVAFKCRTRADVDAFYAAAIAAGGKDNGKPGLRPEYHENYYGAFVIDPEGTNVEAVCHKPPA